MKAFQFIKNSTLIVFTIIFIGCGNPKIDTSTLGKYKESLEVVRNSLPLDKVNDFDMTVLIYSNSLSEINGKTGLEIIAYHQSKLKELQLKQQEKENREAEERAKKNEEITKKLIYRYDFVSDFDVLSYKDGHKKLTLGITIKTNEKNIKNFDDINFYIANLISERSLEEIQTVGGRNLFKDDLFEKLMNVLNNKKEESNNEEILIRILFTEFVIK